MEDKKEMASEVHAYQTEVAKLLKLLANSLYSNKEVFLRELVSNASDAIDKLRFRSITNPELVKDDPVFGIRVRADRDAGTLTISDNGIGMTLDEANRHLGTIAKSGTEEFFANLSSDDAKASQLIGQFGVGFYSAFIVADKVTVLTRAAGAAEKTGRRRHPVPRVTLCPGSAPCRYMRTKLFAAPAERRSGAVRSVISTRVVPVSPTCPS